MERARGDADVLASPDGNGADVMDVETRVCGDMDGMTWPLNILALCKKCFGNWDMLREKGGVSKLDYITSGRDSGTCVAFGGCD